MMNSAAEYTLCNLDSQAHISAHHFAAANYHHSQSLNSQNHESSQNGGSSTPNNNSYSSSSAYNGLDMNNGSGPGGGSGSNGSSSNGPGYPFHPSPTPGLAHVTSASAHNGSLSALPLDISPQAHHSNCSPLSSYDSAVISSHHHHQHPSAYQAAALGAAGVAYQGQPTPFSPYYHHNPHTAGLITSPPNGCISPADLVGPAGAGYHHGYPHDPLGYGHGALLHPQCGSGSGGFLSNGHGTGSGSPTESNVATYKWMTIKRAQPKTSTTSE